MLSTDVTQPEVAVEEIAQQAQRSAAPSDAVGAAEALESLRRAQSTRSRHQVTTGGQGETDRQAARHVLERTRAGHSVSPSTLAKHLEISSASTSAVLSRLVLAQLVTLEANPDDARRKIVIPADITDDPDVYDPVTMRIREIAADLSPAEDALITSFLLRVTAALQQPDDER